MRDAEDVGLEIFVGDDRDEALEGVGVGDSSAGEAVTVQVIGGGVLREDLHKHAALDEVGVRGHIFDEMESLPVLLRNHSWWQHELRRFWHGGDGESS